MPKRLLKLSWYRRHEHRILAVIIGYAIVFLFYAQHQQTINIQHQSRRADQRFARISDENQARSLAAAASSYASCRRQQELALVNNELEKTVIPALIPTPTPYQRHVLRQYRHDLEAHHILTIPICERPPPTG